MDRKESFENYQLKFQKVERTYLTDAELSSIENKEFTIERLAWVRDLFVLVVIPDSLILIQ